MISVSNVKQIEIIDPENGIICVETGVIDITGKLQE